MNRLVWLAGWRALFAQPGLTLLAMLGVALGVATTAAVDLANQGVIRAMRLSVEAATGQATHRLTAPPPGIDEKDYAAWRLRPNAPPAAPIVEGTVFSLVPEGKRPAPAPLSGSAASAPLSESSGATSPEKSPPRTPLTLLGIDPLSEGALRPGLRIPTRGDLLATLLTRPGSALLLEETARKLGVSPGGTLRILANGRETDLFIPGLITSPDPLVRQALAATLLTDIATAQELLGMRGWLSRIDARLPENTPPPVALPAGVNLAPANERIEILENLTRSFRANLSALSLLALLVGTFIIHNAMAFSVVRQRRMIGLKRALGVTRGEILRQTLLDGLLIGLPGTLLGLLLGVALGDTLLQLVARTIDDLYYRMRVVELVIEPFSLFKGLILGVGATLIASWLPAREAATTAVIDSLSRSRLEQQRGTRAPRLALFGLLLILAGWGTTLWPTSRLEAGMLAMGLITVGCALLAPWFTIALMARLRPLLTRGAGLHGALACGGVIRGASRTGMAVAALTVATAMVSGMGILIDGFRGTLSNWLEATTVSDLYVSAAGTLSNSDSIPLEPDLIRALSSVPGVASVGLGRRVNLETPGGMIRLHILEIDFKRFSGLQLHQADHAILWPRFQNDQVVLVTESLAFKQNLKVGDRITLPTRRGPHPFTIGAIHRDFRSDAGMITLSRHTWRAHWPDEAMSVLGIHLVNQAEADTVIEALRSAAGPERSLHIQSNLQLRQNSLEIFDRTFAITRALRLLALLTAFFGVLTALSAIGHERMRELAALRAIGLRVGEIRGSVLLQTALLGLAAGLLAVPLGWMQGWMLLHVINQRAFGWTLENHAGWVLLWQPLWLALPTAILAGLPAARRMAATPPIEALREVE